MKDLVTGMMSLHRCKGGTGHSIRDCNRDRSKTRGTKAREWLGYKKCIGFRSPLERGSKKKKEFIGGNQTFWDVSTCALSTTYFVFCSLREAARRGRDRSYAGSLCFPKKGSSSHFGVMLVSLLDKTEFRSLFTACLIPRLCRCVTS